MKQEITDYICLYTQTRIELMQFDLEIDKLRSAFGNWLLAINTGLLAAIYSRPETIKGSWLERENALRGLIVVSILLLICLILGVISQLINQGVVSRKLQRASILKSQYVRCLQLDIIVADDTLTVGSHLEELKYVPEDQKKRFDKLKKEEDRMSKFAPGSNRAQLMLVVVALILYVVIAIPHA